MIKILLVEDERSIRQAIRFELEDEGFDVIDVCNYEEALSAYCAFKCNLIISDIFFEKGNGIQLINSLKDAPIIAMSAFPKSSLGIKARTLLKDRFIEKPFPIKLLISKVHDVLNSETSNECAA